MHATSSAQVPLLSTALLAAAISGYKPTTAGSVQPLATFRQVFEPHAYTARQSYRLAAVPAGRRLLLSYILLDTLAETLAATVHRS